MKWKNPGMTLGTRGGKGGVSLDISWSGMSGSSISTASLSLEVQEARVPKSKTGIYLTC